MSAEEKSEGVPHGETIPPAAEPLVEELEQAIKDDAAGEKHRRHARLTTPLKIRVGDQTYSALDWSLSGFRIGDVDQFPVAGNQVTTDIIMPFGEFEFSFATPAAIRWIDPITRQAGCEFVDLTPKQKSTLGYFVASFIKGRSLTVEDAVRSIKPDVDDVSVTSDGEVTYRTKWHHLRWARRVGAQFGVAIAAFLLVAVLLRTVVLSTFAFESTAAWVDTPPVEISAPISGMLSVLNVETGMEVTEGNPIAIFRDDMLAQEMDVARAELSRLELAHATVREDAEQRDTVLEQQLQLAELNLESAIARANAANSLANTRQDEFERIETLHARQIATVTHLQEAMRLRIEAEATRQVADADRRAAESQVAIARNGYFVGTSRIAGDDPEFLSRTAADLAQAIVVQRTLIAGLQRRFDALVITSPCDCIVVEVPRRETERLAVGQLYLVMRELEITTEIVAFVRHEEAAALAQGQSVSVRLSDGSMDDAARITSIDTRPTPTNTRMLSSRGHEPSLVAEITIELTDPINTLTRAPVEVQFVQPPLQWLERIFYFDF